MSIRSKVIQRGNVSRFCVERLADYSELLSIEVAHAYAASARRHRIRARGRGAFRAVVRVHRDHRKLPGNALVYTGRVGVRRRLVLSIVALLVLCMQRPVRSLHLLPNEMRNDLTTVKEALK
jgi:hypothetical protein